MSAHGGNEVFVEAVGLAAPGILNWRAALPILRDEQVYVASPLPPRSSELLPPNERRRATAAVRLVFQAGEDAMQSSSIPAAKLVTVFASSDGDLNVIHRICSALTIAPRMISPTDFHNSVHNAAAGYWSIGVGARAPSTTIAAHDFSFAMGLAEACGCVLVDKCDSLLVAFDLPPPEPLYAARPIAQPLSVAMILTRERTSKSVASIHCERTAVAETTLSNPQLESLRIGNPAARSLPLLALIAQRRTGRVVLPQSSNAGLSVELRIV